MPVLFIKIFQISINQEPQHILQVNLDLHFVAKPLCMPLLNRNGKIHELMLGNWEKRGKLSNLSKRSTANIPMRRMP